MENNFNKFCADKKCPEYVEWDCQGSCTSCKLVGQSYNIDQYPPDCIFIEEIMEHEKENIKNSSTN